MKNSLTEKDEKPSIYSEDNIIYKVSDEFLKLIGYKYNDIIGKTLSDLNILLKNDYQVCFEDIEDTYSLYIFTKEDIPRDITITCEKLVKENKKIFYIYQNLNSLLEGLLYNFDNIDINKKESLVVYSYPDCIYLKSNKKYIENLVSVGIDIDNIVGRPPLFPKYILDIIKQGISFHENEVEYIDEKGAYTYWDINARVIFGDVNKKCLIVSFYDVTDNVLERRALEKQRVEMGIILDSISDPINKVNNKGEITYMNKEAKYKMSPYATNLKVLDDKKQFEFFKYNDINGNELSFEDTPIQRVLRGEILKNHIIIGTSHLPTTYHECNGTPIYDELGNIDGGVLVYRDIENIFRLEEYHAFKENAGNTFQNYAYLSYDDFKIIYINETSFSSIKKFKPHIESVLEVMGKDFFEFYCLNSTKNEELIKEIKESIHKKISYSHKRKIETKDEVKYIKTIFKPILDENNNIKNIIVIDVDITDEEIENKEMSKALKVQDEIFINTSHELKTPLNLIYSASQLLDIYLQSDSLEDVKDNIVDSNEIITKNCYRLIKLINNILDISKIESGFYELNLRNINIVELIDNTIQSVSEYIKSSDFNIIFDTEIEELITALDPHKLERVLLNLISNAIKFSDPDGTILVKLVQEDNILEVSVRDNGIGMDSKDLDIIFDKFVQLNTSLSRLAEGTGTGLALVKSIVELHGGKINVESVFGEGSIFKIELPIKTVNNVNANQNEKYSVSKAETIKYELSDISKK